MSRSHPPDRTTRVVLTLALLMSAIGVAQAFGRFTWGFVLPGARDDILGGSNALAGALGTINLAAYLAGTLAVGALTRWLSLAGLIRLGVMLSTAGLGLASVATSPGLLAIGLTMTGLGCAAVWIPGPALAARAVPERRRGLAIGLMASAIGAGGVLVGLIAALLGAEGTTALWQRIYRLEFFLATGVLAATFLLLRSTDDRATGSNGLGGAGALRAVGGWRPLLQAYALFGFSYMLMSSFLVARLRDDAGFTVGQVSTVVTVNGVASILSGALLGRLADRFGERRALIWSFVASTGATLLCLASSFPLVVGAAFVLAVWTTGVPALVASYVVRRTSPRTYGPAFSAVTLALGVTQVMSPPIGGLIADASGSFTLVFLLSALTRAAGLIAATRLPPAVPLPAPASGASLRAEGGAHRGVHAVQPATAPVPWDGGVAEPAPTEAGADCITNGSEPSRWQADQDAAG